MEFGRQHAVIFVTFAMDDQGNRSSPDSTSAPSSTPTLRMISLVYYVAKSFGTPRYASHGGRILRDALFPLESACQTVSIGFTENLHCASHLCGEYVGYRGC